MNRGRILAITAALAVILPAVVINVAVIVMMLTAPKPLEISETKFLEMLKAGTIVPHSEHFAEVDMPDSTLHWVIGYYKDPKSPGGQVLFKTSTLEGSGSNLETLIEGTDSKFPNPPHHLQPDRVMLLCSVYLILAGLVILAARFLFRGPLAPLLRR
jgi:hypothetical protein